MRATIWIGATAALMLAGCAARLPLGNGRLAPRGAASTTLFVPASFRRPPGAQWRFIVGAGSADGETPSEIVAVTPRRVVTRPAPAPLPTPVRRMARGRTVQTAVAVPITRSKARAPVATSRLFTRQPAPAPPAAEDCTGGT